MKERCYSALSDLLLTGGEYPSFGLVNVFSEDKGISDELLRCIRDLGKELNIHFDHSVSLAKGVSTSFVVSIFSTVEKNNLKAKKAEEGLWIYLARLGEFYSNFQEDSYIKLQFIKDLAKSKGVAESYLLKNESIQEGLLSMVKGTDCFYVERDHGIDLLKKYHRGTGILFFSPFKLAKTDDPDIEIIELASMFSKDA